ncbi:Dynein 8 kDa light chain flagellar outer arm [Taenia crassiceps]|uniref:Dynein 8 kDa light chain flagellar outer arm n=1 Tax=Taenia crassiceps TaxID=6207 RepID=A0ABR4Q5I0_9CEST
MSDGTRKAVVKNVDMSEEMQQDAIDVATHAFEKFNIEKDIAAYIKKEFDKRHSPTWHCVRSDPYQKAKADVIAQECLLLAYRRAGEGDFDYGQEGMPLGGSYTLLSRKCFCARCHPFMLATSHTLDTLITDPLPARDVSNVFQVDLGRDTTPVITPDTDDYNATVECFACEVNIRGRRRRSSTNEAVSDLILKKVAMELAAIC